MKSAHAAACRFFSAEDACRLALASYFAASRNIEPPHGQPWFSEVGDPWSSEQDFSDRFVGEFQARVALLGLQLLGRWVRGESSWDLEKLAAAVEPDLMAPVIEQMQAEKGDFLRAEGNDLPPLVDSCKHRSDGAFRHD